MNWEGPPVYLEVEQPAREPFVYTDRMRRSDAWSDGYRSRDDEVRGLVGVAYVRGYADGVGDSLSSVRWAAFGAQLYGVDLWVALGL